MMRAFTSGQMKANEAFLKLLEKKEKKKVIRAVASNIRGDCSFLVAIWDNKVSTEEWEKTSPFLMNCLLKTSRRVNTSRSNHHLL